MSHTAHGTLDAYQLGKPIGQGAYAMVYQCVHKATMKKYAIKIYQKAKLNDSMKRKAVQREIMALKKIDHPHIIRMLDLIETSKQICIVTDYISGSSLHHYVKHQCPNRQVKEETCRRFFKQIAEAFEYLHSRGVAHRDLKLDNVLIEEKTNMIKIIDFGFAAFCQDGQKQKIFCGTPSYMAPELVRRAEYDGRQVDMWALGVLLYAMLAGSFPFRGQSEKELYAKIQRCNVQYPPRISREAEQVIGQLLEVETRRRMRASDLLKSSWISCEDLPLSIFETAGNLFRGNSAHGRAIMDHTLELRQDSGPQGLQRSSSKAEIFNRSLAKLHVRAVDHLKNLGFSSKAIEESLRTTSVGDRMVAGTMMQLSQKQVYNAYKEQIEVSLKNMVRSDSKTN
jgi:serine/threonine protein kinase